MKNDYIVKKLYISFVVVSILSALTATAGMLIDNIVVGAFLGDDALGAMGIVGPISLIFSAFGNICSGGGTARAAQALGKGEIDKVRQIFTVTMIFVIVSGLLLTLVGVFFTPQIATFLGAKGELLEPTVDYLRGFFLGAIPTIMLTALAGFVKIDGSPRLPLVSIVVMSVANIILDLMMVMVFDAGMYGMALATTISYVLAVLTSCTHFLKKTSTLGLAKPIKGGKEMMSMVTTGAPTAISRICDTIKVMVLNNILVLFVSVGAVTALNVRTQANNFFGAFIMGLAQASVPPFGNVLWRRGQDGDKRYSEKYITHRYYNEWLNWCCVIHHFTAVCRYDEYYRSGNSQHGNFGSKTFCSRNATDADKYSYDELLSKYQKYRNGNHNMYYPVLGIYSSTCRPFSETIGAYGCLGCIFRGRGIYYPYHIGCNHTT